MTSAASCRHVKQCNLATPSKTSMRTCHTAELVCHWLGLGAARHSDGTMPCSNLKMTMCDSRCRDWCPPPLRRDSHISAGAHHGSGRDVCSAICRDKVQRTSLMKIAASIDITSRGSWDSSGTFSEPALEPACMLSYRPHSEALSRRFRPEAVATSKISVKMLCSQQVAQQTYRAHCKVGRVPLRKAHSDVTGNILVIGMTRHHRAVQATCELPVTYKEAALSSSQGRCPQTLHVYVQWHRLVIAAHPLACV